MTVLVRYRDADQAGAEAFASAIGGVAVPAGQVLAGEGPGSSGLVFLRCNARDIWTSRFSVDRSAVPFAVVGMTRPIERLRYSVAVALLGEEWRSIDDKLEQRAIVDATKWLLGATPPVLVRPSLRSMALAALAVILVTMATLPVTPRVPAVLLDIASFAASHLFMTSLNSGRSSRSPVRQVSAPRWVNKFGSVIQTAMALLLLGHALLRWSL